MSLSIEVGSVCVTGVRCKNCGKSVEYVEEWGDIHIPDDFEIEMRCDNCATRIVKRIVISEGEVI